MITGSMVRPVLHDHRFPADPCSMITGTLRPVIHDHGYRGGVVIHDHGFPRWL